jgi:alkylation response protein AidB-like acyl-CoA dehydrogenase
MSAMNLPDYNAMSDEEFRAVARTFLKNHYPDELRNILRRSRWSEIGVWYRTLSREGWIAPNWPREYGGMGLDTAKMIVLLEEQEDYGVARGADHGLIQVGPIIIRYGTDEQKQHYLPKILSCEHIWAQGYSEPNSGSDLASLRTEAIPDGNDFVVNGQKIWTTLGHDATHFYMLVRTSKEGKKQAGISFLLVDAKSPGITVRTIDNIAGNDDFCEVFFENVRVPQANLVGGLNNGWTVAKALLSLERINIGSPRRPSYALKRLELLARERGLFDDAGFVDKFTALKLDMADLASLYARYVDMVKRGEKVGPDVAMLKIWATESWQRLTDLLVETAQEYGSQQGELAIGDARVDVLNPFYYARAGTIYGGTSEILRNVIAKDVLQLPV